MSRRAEGTRRPAALLAAALALAACDEPAPPRHDGPASSGPTTRGPGASVTPAGSATPSAAATPRPATATPEGPRTASGTASAEPEPLGAGALELKNRGKLVRRLDMAALVAAVKPEQWNAYDAYYQRQKTFRALELGALLAFGFAGEGLDLQKEQFVLRARDGFTVPIAGAKLLEGGAYVAIADVEVPGWEPIGPQRANPGPFYLVWRKPGQQDLEAYPRPWQLASIEVASFEDTFPLTVPKGEPEGSPALAGFAIFREQCIRCHAVNQQGGRIGPDLNVPRSIVDYRPVDQIKAYIRDPRTFRYSNMPSHSALTEADLDGLVAYFRAMSTRQHDPARP
ncbi:MAG: cytochrome c [Myxococcales bacterium]|nr:cytochrome c [Myxococcales bacterium]